MKVRMRFGRRGSASPSTEVAHYDRYATTHAYEFLHEQEVQGLLSQALFDWGRHKDPPRVPLFRRLVIDKTFDAGTLDLFDRAVAFASEKGHPFVENLHFYHCWNESLPLKAQFVDPHRFSEVMDELVQRGIFHSSRTRMIIHPALYSAVNLGIVDASTNGGDTSQLECGWIVMNLLAPQRLNTAVLDRLGKLATTMLDQTAISLGSPFLDRLPQYRRRYGLSTW